MSWWQRCTRDGAADPLRAAGPAETGSTARQPAGVVEPGFRVPRATHGSAWTRVERVFDDRGRLRGERVTSTVSLRAMPAPLAEASGPATPPGCLGRLFDWVLDYGATAAAMYAGYALGDRLGGRPWTVLGGVVAGWLAYSYFVAGRSARRDT